MGEKMLTLERILLALYAFGVFGMTLTLYDDYMGDRQLIWFEREEAGCFNQSESNCANYMPTENAMYMISWRLLNNLAPGLSEYLAPTPQFEKRVSIKDINMQDYYYDCWYGKTIVVDGSYIAAVEK